MEQKMLEGQVVVDIGGSGSRIGISTHFGVADVRRHYLTSVDELCRAISITVPAVSNVAVSVPGFVDGDSGRVRKRSVAPWLEGDLGVALQTRLALPNPAIVVNDGGAHALALLKETDVQLGAFVVSLGTSVGFGVLDVTGSISRTLSGQNWDVGDFLLKSSASDPHVWSALGQSGLDELHRERTGEALVQYGYRLGAWLTQMAIIFQPRTIALSGGNIARYWHQMEAPVRSELAQLPDYLVGLRLVAMADNEPALTGLTTLF